MTPTKRKSINQERAVAKSLKGRVTPASGALWGSKGDVRNQQFLVECKITEKAAYRLEYTTWHKIKSEANHDGMREPAMCIGLQNGKVNLAVLQLDSFDTDVKVSTVIECVKAGLLVKWDDEPYLINFKGKRNTKFGGKDVILIVNTWDWFVDYLNDWDNRREL